MATPFLILEEAHRLYHKFHLAVHWIKPNSKAPVKAGWSSGSREDWDTIKREYREGYGLGVRLGSLSDLGGSFLANIDVDIKSQEPRHRKEALTALEKYFPGILANGTPTVKTQMGLRFFVRTPTPVQSKKIISSAEIVKVRLPHEPVNLKQQKRLTPQELAEGFRTRPAWEIDFMSAGKQVVLPPSIHPATQKPYIWEKPLNDINHMPIINTGGLNLSSEVKINSEIVKFNPTGIDLEKDTRLTFHVKQMIIDGDGIEDRSSACFSVTISMLRAGFSDDDILTILTNPNYSLGEVGYDRRGKDRSQAADWVRRYCLDKAKAIAGVGEVFKAGVSEAPLLDDDAARAQFDELVGRQLSRRQNGSLIDCLKNTVLILEDEVGKDVFRHNLLTDRFHFYGKNPWGAKSGEPVIDRDIAKIMFWFGKKFKIEPSKDRIFNAILNIGAKNTYHPVIDELRALPPWDGVSRLDNGFKTYFNVNMTAGRGYDEYLAQVFRKWLVGSVKRTFEPGAQFDWMPILQGAQGIGKGRFSKFLFGEEYYRDNLPPLHDRDAAFALQGNRVIEFGELASLNKNDLETTKGFITRAEDKVRPVHGILLVGLKRQCVFIGTTNAKVYLKDDSGNRRFKPVEVNQLNEKLLIKDRDQLWAEALFIYDNYLEGWLDTEGLAKEYERSTHATKMIKDNSWAMVEDILAKSESSLFNFDKFEMRSLFHDTGPLAQNWKWHSANVQFAWKALEILKAEKLPRVNNQKYWRIDFEKYYKYV